MTHRVSLGSGSPEGENSAYVLPERGVVVDTGPPSDGAWRRLRAGIEGSGLALSDVETVVLTHWHADHAGNVDRLVEASGARVVMHELDAPLVGDYARERGRRLERDTDRLREWGVPDATVSALVDGDSPSPVPDSLPVEGLEDGDEVAGLELLHTPGHTLGHAALVGDDTFLGDLVLPTYTPNVGGGDTRLDDALATYLDSLNRLCSVATGRAYPGHGSELDLHARADEIRTHHEARGQRVTTLVDSSGPVTPWNVATTLFGEMAGVHVKMGAGEAASHLDHLVSTGVLELVDEHPSRYAPVSV